MLVIYRSTSNLIARSFTMSTCQEPLKSSEAWIAQKNTPRLSQLPKYGNQRKIAACASLAFSRNTNLLVSLREHTLIVCPPSMQITFWNSFHKSEDGKDGKQVSVVPLSLKLSSTRPVVRFRTLPGIQLR